MLRFPSFLATKGNAAQNGDAWRSDLSTAPLGWKRCAGGWGTLLVALGVVEGELMDVRWVMGVSSKQQGSSARHSNQKPIPGSTTRHCQDVTRCPQMVQLWAVGSERGPGPFPCQGSSLGTESCGLSGMVFRFGEVELSYGVPMDGGATPWCTRTLWVC